MISTVHWFNGWMFYNVSFYMLNATCTRAQCIVSKCIQYAFYVHLNKAWIPRGRIVMVLWLFHFCSFSIVSVWHIIWILDTGYTRIQRSASKFWMENGNVARRRFCSVMRFNCRWILSKQNINGNGIRQPALHDTYCRQPPTIECEAKIGY